MKRERSPGSAGSPAPKRLANKVAAANGNEPCRLLQMLAQYGLLIAIASNLYPEDLFALAATSKAAYKVIFSRGESRSNLLNKMPCDGRGVALRSLLHQKSRYFSQFNCTEYIQCGTSDTTHTVETRPCAACAHTTCDECRIHCVYQSIYQPPDEPDDLPNLSGFALLSPHEMGILTPSHIGYADETSTEVAPMAWSRPYNDQGFLDPPLESNTYACMESVAEILDFNLGHGPLKLSASSNSIHPSPVIQAFWDVSQERIRRVCNACFEERQQERAALVDDPTCNCTLRDRFLSRWLCLPCYQLELEETKSFPCGTPDACACGQGLASTSTRSMCLWCWGDVRKSDLAL